MVSGGAGGRWRAGCESTKGTKDTKVYWKRVRLPIWGGMAVMRRFDDVGRRCYDVSMRTTLTIDDDVLAVARALAERNG